MFRICHRINIWALPLLVLAGCGSEEVILQSELPAPGTLELIDVRPLDAEQRGSLIENGSFDEWYAGAPSPSGFNAPQASLSVMRRDAEVKALSPLGFRAIQTWRKNDSDAEPKARFGTWVNVQPGAEYELRVIATSWKDAVAVIDVFEEGADGALQLLEAAAITVEPSLAVKEYVKTFTVREATRLFIASALPAGAEPAGSVVWHTWYLY